MNIYDILNHAVKIENEGMNFYNSLYNRASSEYRGRIFQALMQEENNHAILFNEIKNQAQKIFNIEEVNKKIDFKLEDIFTEENFLVEEHTFEEIINHAISTEYKTIEYYIKIIEYFNHEKEKEIIDNMIKEEEKHVLKLKEMIFYDKMNISQDDHCSFIDTLINNMDDLVQVIDNKDNIIFTNEAMNRAAGKYLIGKKRSHSINIKNLTELENHGDKVIINNNNRYYSLISSPIRNREIEQNICIEVFRDITKEKQMENKIIEQNNKFTRELDISRKIQYSLLPSKLDYNVVKADYYYTPCEKIGGDLIDIYRIDENHIGFYICDVSGHGVPAAMLTMFMSQNIDKSETSSARVLDKVYKKFLDLHFNDEMYITVFFGIIDIQKNIITYSNAGHHVEPIVYNKQEESIFTLNATGMPISTWFNDIIFNEKQKELRPDDCILLSTDGLIELENKGQMLGMARIKELIKNNKDKKIYEMKKILENEIKEYCPDISHLKDDITFLLIKFK